MAGSLLYGLFNFAGSFGLIYYGFGHVSLISAAGRSANEILAANTDRPGPRPDTELLGARR